MADATVVHLPDIQERFLRVLDVERFRAALLSKGIKGDAIDAALSNVEERLKKMPMKATIEPGLIEAMYDLTGFMTAEMIALELEIYYLKNGTQYFHLQS